MAHEPPKFFDFIRGLPAKVILKENPFISLIRFRKYIIEHRTYLALLINFYFGNIFRNDNIYYLLFIITIYYLHVTFFSFINIFLRWKEKSIESEKYFLIQLRATVTDCQANVC